MQNQDGQQEIIGKVQGAIRKYLILEKDRQVGLQTMKRQPVRMIGKKNTRGAGEFTVAYSDGTIERWHGCMKTGIGTWCFIGLDGKTMECETHGYKEGWPRP